jgi:hypothetical protein
MGVLIGIYPYADKIPVEDLNNLRVRQRGFIKNVAPVAPRCAQAKVYGFVFLLGLRKRLFAPLFPIYKMGLVRSW